MSSNVSQGVRNVQSSAAGVQLDRHDVQLDMSASVGADFFGRGRDHRRGTPFAPEPCVNAARMTHRPPATVDFRYDFRDDIVFARPRCTLETPGDVQRWYELHARYFTARFSRAKDLVMVHDAFEIGQAMHPLWDSYLAKLHESMVRFSAAVTNQPTSHVERSGSRPRISAHTVQANNLADAIASIRTRRDALRETRPSGSMRSPVSIRDGGKKPPIDSEG
jgi:hypothetical protein